MLRWMIHLVDSLSYWGVGLLMAIENIVLPLPSEVIMPVGGFEASRGRMTLWGVVRETFVRGVRVYENGRFPSPPVGRWLRR